MDITAIRFVTQSVVESSLSTETVRFTLNLDTVAPTDPYILRTAVGLDPDEIMRLYYGNMSEYRYHYQPEERFYDMKPAPRVITFDIKLNPNYTLGQTPSSLRDAIYRIIAGHHGARVIIQFMNGETIVAQLKGFVERLESDLFDSEPAVRMTIRCIDPFLRAPEKTMVSVTDLNLVINDNVSTAPHGLFLRTVMTEATNNFVLKGIAGTDKADFLVNHTFNAGDILYLSTDPTDRYIYVIDPPDFLTPKYIMDKVIQGSIWPMVFPGENFMEIITEDDQTISELSYYNTYWGV